ncbi:MAG TPA: peroxiredoxin [Clostridia bacterium]|nr:peroxiredoxin [Clostridia bacterium]
MDEYRSLMIGSKAPHFQANTTYGPVSFPEDYKGKWVVFFSHPGDFTPVCTTEMMTFASMKSQFDQHNCMLMGLSIDSNPSHIEWSRAIEGYQWKDLKNVKMAFPIVADDLGTIAKMYGMLMPMESATRTVRDVFFIDPEGVIRAILSYPLTTGRNMKEIMRLLLALQAYDSTGNPTPADWEPGEDQILPVPQTMPTAGQRLDESKSGGIYCIDWYLCFTRADGGMHKTAPEQAAKQIVSKPEETAMNMEGRESMKKPMARDSKTDMDGAAGMSGESIMEQNLRLMNEPQNQGKNFFDDFPITRDYPFIDYSGNKNKPRR